MTTDTDALRKALAAATPGPWEHDGGWTVTAPSPEGWEGPYMVTMTDQCRADAALIVAAVNALPDLLDERDRMLATIARVEAALEATHRHGEFKTRQAVLAALAREGA